MAPKVLSADSRALLSQMRHGRQEEGSTQQIALTLDQMPDALSDTPRQTEVRGSMVMLEGKFKAKAGQEGLTMSEVYVHQKSYIQWVRSHIGQGSGVGMRALKLYVELRDFNKSRRIQQERDAPAPSQAPIPPSPPSEWSRVSTPRGRVETADGRVFSWEERAVPVPKAAAVGYANRHRRPIPPNNSVLGRRSMRDDDMETFLNGHAGGEPQGISDQCEIAFGATQGQEMVSALLARMLSPNTPFPMEEEHQ